MNEETKKAGIDGMKERIFHSVTTMPEKRLAVGCWIVALVGLYVLLVFVNGLFWWSRSPTGTLLVAAGEFVILVIVYFLFGLIPRLLEPIVGKVGFLYHSGTSEESIKPDVHRALSLVNKRDFPGAVKQYRLLFSRFPDRIDFLYEIAEIYRRDIGDMERAIASFRQIARMPEEGPYAYLIGQAKFRIEQLEGRVPPPPDRIELE